MNTDQSKHLLVPLDFSEASLNALESALQIAKRQDLNITLIHVISHESLIQSGYESMPVATIVFDSIKKEVKDRMRSLAKDILERHGLGVNMLMPTGAIAVEVTRAASQMQAEMIVMGTHGSSGLKEFFLGTNAYDVIKRSTCPVLTIPPNQKWNGFSKILFPVREVANALDKYQHLRKIIQKNKAKLIVLGIVKSPAAKSIQSIQHSINYLDHELKRDEVKAVLKISTSPKPAEQVLRFAKQESIDLIAITADFDYEIADFFIGPFTQQIVNHASVPVVSIRPGVMASEGAEIIKQMQEALYQSK
ncbi:universal stress protein [Haliscomenobacter sp.]|uniref:universal stress protein n=1 Tax=Haliscomenobacter sp. TaxID=2717303 RepID=UPI003592F133